MNKQHIMNRGVACLLTLFLIISSVNLFSLTSKAATEIDLSSYITMSGTSEKAHDNGEGTGVNIIELLFNLPDSYDEKSEWEANNFNSLIVKMNVSAYTGSYDNTPGGMLMFMSDDWSNWNQGNYVNLTTSGTMEFKLDITSLKWGGSTKVGKLGIQFCNLTADSTITYSIDSAIFSSETVSTGGSESGEDNPGNITIPAGDITDYNYDDIDYNYAKLLQYSLYFYDANMCGSEVGETSLLDWRDACHTYDTYNYTRTDGTTISVDLTGGFHDAGDHVKFGLPEAYAAFTLGMSYDTNKSAYQAAKQVGHLQTITTHFADYLTKCAVLNSDGTAVEAFCVQVGNGGGGYDHGYWGAPEAQPQSNRAAYFSSDSAPHTDIVSLSAAALAMQYKNFGGEKYLNTAKLLFDYAKNHSKSVGTSATTFYTSSNWEDDYCLAALLLYQITGDSAYKTEYDNYKGINAAMKPYWPLGWDNVGPAVAYYDNNTGKLATLMGISDGNSTYGGYRCVSNWGSARYNTSMQYIGLMYDKLTGTDTYRNWAEGQMKYLLGNNASKQCFVIGYNKYGSKYPHHKAASGYTGGDKGTTAQAHELLGALVGGQKIDGTYTDSASDYVCNEVAIDYNATLVAAAAAIYEKYTTDTTTQYVDTNYYTDGGTPIDPEPEEIKVTGITLNKTSLELIVGDTSNLTATIAPSDATNKAYTWSVKDSKIATIDEDGVVTAVKAGTTVVTATTEDGGKTASCTVVVTDPEPEEIAVTGITLNKTSLELIVGDTSNLTATIAPSDATNKAYTWSVKDSKIATIDEDGVVTAVKAGTTVVTATTEDGGKTASCTVVVTDPEPEEIAVKGITLNKTSLELTVGDTSNLTATVAPSDATNKAYTWSVKDSKIATIDEDGVVTAVKAGTTVVTAITKDGGKTATCTVVVIDQEPNPEPVIEKPATVKNVKGITLGKNKAQITWDKVDDAEGYLVYAQKYGKYGYCGMTTSKDITTFTDTKALDDDFGFYWVFAYKKNADGKMITGGCEKYTYAKGICLAVTDFKASSVVGGVKLTWTKSVGANGYLIYGINADGKYHYIGMTSGTTFTDKKASKTEYNFYWIFPYHKNADGKMIPGQICSKYVYGRAR